MKKEIKYCQAVKGATAGLKQGFVQVYSEAFSGPPYFEKYDGRYVETKVWETHLASGCIILALAGSRVIGLGCCIPFVNLEADDPNYEVKLFLQARKFLPFELERTGYMSEIAVLQEYRRQGIGQRLVEERFRWLKSQRMNFYAMRTAASCSNSLNLYRSLGAQPADFIQDVSGAEIASASHQRIFLHGRLG